ncbi:MAG: transcriptional regulator [Candidatus Bathyarchaeia archaeon]
MPLSCERVAHSILPIYRSAVARELTKKHKFTQVEAAKKLGTTQAAISQYINSKRGFRDVPNYEQIAPLIQKAAEKAAERMAASEMSYDEFNDSFCDICKQLRDNNICV